MDKPYQEKDCHIIAFVGEVSVQIFKWNSISHQLPIRSLYDISSISDGKRLNCNLKLLKELIANLKIL
jgi:hypothetical protein